MTLRILEMFVQAPSFRGGLSFGSKLFPNFGDPLKSCLSQRQNCDCLNTHTPPITFINLPFGAWSCGMHGTHIKTVIICISNGLRVLGKK